MEHRRFTRRLVAASIFFLFSFEPLAAAAPLPSVRIAHGAFNEKVLALWIGAQYGFFRKHGVNVEVVNIRSGPQTSAALASGEIQIAYTIPGTVLSAAAGGMDVAFFGGVVNRADGDFVVAPALSSPQDLRGKKVGVQSIGGGVWSLAMLALEYLGLEPTRDKITIMVLGDQPVLTQALATGRIDAAYLGYTFSTLLKEKGFRVLVDLGKAPIDYQGLALATQRSYIRQNPQIIDSLLRGTLESVAFVQTPLHKDLTIQALVKYLKLKDAQEAKNGYEALQWLYSLDIKPSLRGIQNMQRLLGVANPKVKALRAEEMIDDAPVRLLERSEFYRELVMRRPKE